MKKALIGVGVSVALVLTLVGGLALSGRAKANALGTRLIAEVRALEEDRHLRPAHVDAADPRSFGELLEPHLEGLRAARAIETELTEADRLGIRQVGEGKSPVASLTPAARTWLDAGRASAAGARAATRSQSARHPEGMRIVSDAKHPGQQDGMLLLQTAAKITAVAIHESLEAGDVAGALAICLDGAALGRDASHEMGVLGMVVGSVIDGLVFDGCAAAIDRAPAAAKRDAAMRLRRVVEGSAPMKETMRQETVSGELLAFASTLGEKARAELSPAARSMIGEGENTGMIPFVGTIQRATLRAAWAEHVPQREEMTAALEAPIAERDARLAAVAAKAEQSWNPLTRIAYSDFSRFDDRRRHGRALLEGLARAAEMDAARAETGAWPPITAPADGEPQARFALGDDGVLLVTAPILRDPSQPAKPPREARFRAD